MSRERDTRVWLNDIADACRRIQDYVGGMDIVAFRADRKTVDAVVRNLEIVGEATKQLPDEFRSSWPEIEWRKIAGLRDVLIHGYHSVDDDIVWRCMSLPFQRAAHPARLPSIARILLAVVIGAPFSACSSKHNQDAGTNMEARNVKMDAAVGGGHDAGRALVTPTADAGRVGNDAGVADDDAGHGKPSVPQTFKYRNPILWNGNEELRDPCIIREADTYYLVFTVFPFTNNTSADPNKPDYNSSPGIKLYSSTDLTTWTFVKWLVKSSELPESSPYKHRFWAPELHKIAGRFFLIFTADNWIKDSYNPAGHMGGFAFVGVADRVTGPYQHISYVAGGAIDTSLFEASDGSTYAIIPRGGIDVQAIDLTKIDQDQVQLLGQPKRILDPSDQDVGLAQTAKYLEGPWVTRKGKRYYGFYAANFDDGYWTGLAYADSPLGPWKKDPLGSKFFWGGHVAVFDGPDQRMWFSYRGEKFRDSWGRLGIDPIDMDASGQLHPVGPTYQQDITITYTP